MEPTQDQSHIVQTLTSVSPLSKYLAMILFITLPFVGTFIGYSYGKASQVAVTKSEPVAQTKMTDKNSDKIQSFLLTEETTVKESDETEEFRVDITHTETVAVRLFPDSDQFVQFDISSIQTYYRGDMLLKNGGYVASMFDYNQHLKFNSQTNVWYLEDTEDVASTSLFKVHKINGGEDVVAKLTNLYKTSILDEYDRDVLSRLAHKFPQMEESFFLNRDFCEISVEKRDGYTFYSKSVKSEFKEAVSSMEEHFAVFCYSPTVQRIGDILIENYYSPMDATQPKTFDFKKVDSVE